MIICKIDDGFFAAETNEIAQTDPCPIGWVRANPPPLTGVQVARWAVSGWEILPSRPIPMGQTIQDLVRLAVLSIDSDADQIYAAALGNRATEYAQAEADATGYKAAGYTGTVPGYVQAWAEATGKSATWATDNILATAAAWRAAQAQIRSNRLACKEAARSATTMKQLTAAQDRWTVFVTAITAQLGL